jgi:hypothetical protein
MKTMGILLMGILAVMLLTSCEQVSSLFDDFGVTTYTDYYVVDVIIPPAESGSELSVQHPVQNDIEQVITEQGYGEATVTSITVDDAYMIVVEDSRIPTMNSIQSVNTLISTESLPEATMLTCTNNQADATELPMEDSGLNVSSYMQGPEYILTIKGNLKETTTDILHIQGLVKYKVELEVKKEQ